VNRVLRVKRVTPVKLVLLGQWVQRVKLERLVRLDQPALKVPPDRRATPVIRVCKVRPAPPARKVLKVLLAYPVRSVLSVRRAPTASRVTRSLALTGPPSRATPRPAALLTRLQSVAVFQLTLEASDLVCLCLSAVLSPLDGMLQPKIPVPTLLPA
jgi:hypothetical protein